MNEDHGWIKLHRKILEWEWRDDHSIFVLFIYCLFKANYEDKRWHGLIIKRGQFITSRGKLAKEVGLSIQKTRTILYKLKSTNEITINTTNKYTVITINNYNNYQLTTNSLTNNQPTNNQQITTTKEYKNIRNSKPIENLEEKKQELTEKLSIKKTGISKEFQDRAFRYADNLKIQLKDEKLKGRWLSLFKNGNRSRLDRACSYLVDYPPFLAIKTDEGRMKYFFWYYGNKTL